jgi:tetratricopeptide (TPR) repeat protein
MSSPVHPPPPPATSEPTAQDAFADIYRQAIWGKNNQGAGNSGPGSTLHATQMYRTFLQQFLKDRDIHSVVDAGCGDWEFSQALDWSGIDYKGFDIVESAIAQNNQKFAKANIQFFAGNVVELNLPPADLLICKHVLQHLPTKDVQKFLTQLAKYKHVLLTNSVNSDTMSAANGDIVVGGFRTLDPTAPPFNLPGTKLLNYWDGYYTHQVVHIAITTAGNAARERVASVHSFTAGQAGVRTESRGLLPPSSDAEFARAVEYQRQGRLADAERACQRILTADSRHFAANYLLGIIALQQGHFEIAETRLRLAVEINPNVASAYRDLGIALGQLGRADEAFASFDRAMALKPDYAELFGHRGNVLQQLGRFEESLANYDKAITGRAASPIVHYNRGAALSHLSRLDEALESFDRAIALKPDYFGAHAKRATVLMELRRHDDALASFDRAIALKPDHAETFYNRGLAFQELARSADAIANYDRAIALKGGFAAAFNNRGNALKDLQRFEEALSDYDQAIAASPDFAEAFYNRGVVLLELKRPEEALASYDRAIMLQPDYPEAHFSRGLCKLAMGLAAGWNDFEHRWRLKNYPTIDSGTDAPPWSGEELRGRSILVCAEQGLGDVIQFSRYLPQLAESGADVSFLAPEKLHGILSGLPGKVRLISAVTRKERFDFRCALMSLPQLLGADLTNIPGSIPYLAVDPTRAAEWQRRMGPHGFKIGISWQGALWHGGAAIVGRSIPLMEFLPLSQIPGVRLISLQKGHGVEQLATLPSRMMVETLGDNFDGGQQAFADTVAVAEHLDLIITCDTSIAHVAGACGRPTWIALQYVPEWRWLLAGGGSPWYPTARLFRQQMRGDWSTVFRDMASELTRMTV